MRKTTKLALLLSAALLATSEVAQDHLVPPGGIAEYQDVVSKLFKEAFTDDVHVRATVEPPHPSEFAVGTKVMNGRYRIFYLQANDYIWFALYNEKGNGPLLNKTLDHEIGIDSCEYDISNETGERLDLIWDTMLRGTRPDESKYII